ncbi:MAG: MBOAT family O-acyltransferase [Bacteroidota bacterium]
MNDSQLLDNIKDFFLFNREAPMMFNTSIFLFAFLAFLGVYLMIADRKRLRIIYVLAFSLFFYYKSSGWHVALLLVSTLIDYSLGFAIHQEMDQKKRKMFLILSILANLGMLAVFKYTNFFLESMFGIAGAKFDPLDIVLPVGISFFTFQTMSYTIDIYRRKLRPADNILDFAFFVSFFPQLVAGPIVRAAEFLPQIKQNIQISQEDISRAVLLICGGLFKKAVISDYIATNFVDRVFENPDLYTGFENLMGVYGYAMQIYCDFSGYSDMAIGIGLLMGFRLPINFRTPYQSTSIQEFWRRWHISLSSFLRDYLYISMGGNRLGRWRTYLNLMITMVLGGLWHGAAWKFVVWGALHGVALTIDRLTRDTKTTLRNILAAGLDKFDQFMLKRSDDPDDQFSRISWMTQGWLSLAVSIISHLAGIFFTFHFVCFCWIFFRANSYELAIEMINRIFSDFSLAQSWEVLIGYRNVFLLMILGYLLHFLPEDIDLFVYRRFVNYPVLVKSVVLAFVIWLVIQTRSADVQPFIYFQF